jgi:hypothetical protein
LKFTTKSLVAIAAVVLVLALPVVISAAAPTADTACQKTSTDGCWVTTYLGAQDLGSGVTQLTFDILPTTTCQHDVSYIGFGFPNSWGVGSPANGSSYVGPKTTITFGVSVPAGGKITDPKSIKFQPPGGTWHPGSAERFVFSVTGYNATGPIYAYGHAGGGPNPQQVTFATLDPSCNVPTAITLSELSAISGSRSLPALTVLGVGMIVLGAVGMVRRPRK